MKTETRSKTLLDVVVACGDSTMAMELFERMEEVDRLDVIPYNTILKLLMKQRAWVKVEVVLEEMRGSRPAAKRGDVQLADQRIHQQR